MLGSAVHSALPAIDFSRHAGLLDHALLKRAHIACVGVGGAAGLVASLARAGIGRFTLVDHDHVAPTNPATQAHDAADIGMHKVEALRRRLERINPAVNLAALPKHYADLSRQEHNELWRADVMLAMTDHFPTQAAVNRDAIERGPDAIFALCYIGCDAFDITATFRDSIVAGFGCHRCHAKARYDAYASGFENPSVIASHALTAEHLNALLGLLVVSRLHQRASSPLAISSIASAFARRPCLIGRINPALPSTEGANVIPQLAGPFAAQLYGLDSPSDWTCPDCGTRGVVPPTSEFQRPLANPGPGTTQERS